MKLPVHTLSAAALVTRGDEVLLIRSPRRGWEFPGGMVEQGESVIQGLMREIREETGVEVQVTAFVGAYSNLVQKDGYGPLEGTKLPTVLNLTFLCEYVSGDICLSEESTDVAWVSREEAMRRVTFPPFVKRLEDMLSYNGTVCFQAFEMSSDRKDFRIAEEIRL